MRIHGDFLGGNVTVTQEEGSHIYLSNQLRDTVGDWFYWAFCVEGAAGKTLTFHLGDCRLGYFGPAVSYDLVNWHWLGQEESGTFTYEFSPDEDRVYFAHHMLYHPARFLRFAEERCLTVSTLCISRFGKEVPCLVLGEGGKTVLLTARHHACESTGNYVLEGVLEELIERPLEGYRVLCVPFVDYEGVLAGDQGKGRAPYDHNRDYNPTASPIYPVTSVLRQEMDKGHVEYAFDFHSPWHIGDRNDTCFIVQGRFDHQDAFNGFAEAFESEVTPLAFPYRHQNDIALGVEWNQPGVPAFFSYAWERGARLAFTLETAYFGTDACPVSGDNLKETGRCFARALRRFAKQ